VEAEALAVQEETLLVLLAVLVVLVQMLLQLGWLESHLLCLLLGLPQLDLHILQAVVQVEVMMVLAELEQ
jgi:hypothetical protein